MNEHKELELNDINDDNPIDLPLLFEDLQHIKLNISFVLFKKNIFEIKYLYTVINQELK